VVPSGLQPVPLEIVRLVRTCGQLRSSCGAGRQAGRRLL
jgi:hypothetical protein